MRPAGGLRARAALGAAVGAVAAVLIVGVVLGSQSDPDGRGGLVGTLILAALVGGALAAGLTAFLMNREVRALRQVRRSTESLLSPEGAEPFPRTGGPEIRELTRVNRGHHRRLAGRIAGSRTRPRPPRNRAGVHD